MIRTFEFFLNILLKKIEISIRPAVYISPLTANMRITPRQRNLNRREHSLNTPAGELKPHRIARQSNGNRNKPFRPTSQNGSCDATGVATRKYNTSAVAEYLRREVEAFELDSGDEYEWH